MVSTLTVLLLGLVPALAPVGEFTAPAQAAPSCSPVETVVGSDKVLQFTSVGTCDWVPPAGVAFVQYLVVGGGGAGGTVDVGSSGGGGGGRVLESTSYPLNGATTFSITVGAGGQTTNPTTVSSGQNGGTSSITPSGGTTISALGGGGGANSRIYNVPQWAPSTTGWTGGGGSSHAATFSNGSTGVGGATYKGGNAIGDGSSADPQAGGGGGGAGGAGQNAVAYKAGSGGIGVNSTITGTTVGFGGGGGGGKRTATGTGASAGTATHGGGAGGLNGNGTSGLANRGGGGGGAGETAGVGGAGGSGVVLIRFSQSITNQTVSWTPTNTTVAASAGSATLSPSAVSSGGTAITYSVVSAGTPNCQISNSASPVVTFNSTGTCTLKASTAGDWTISSAESSLITLTVGYKVTYFDNASQHQLGVISSGTVPVTSFHAANSTVTVPNNPGNIVRSGFILGGWQTTTSGGTNYTLGTGTFSITADQNLYAAWVIPEAARLIGGTGALAVTNSSITGAPDTTGVRGVTNDGSHLFYRPAGTTTVIRETNFNGSWVADHVVTGLDQISAESAALSYSNGCIFLRGTSLTSLYCVNTSTWTLRVITLPAGQPLDNGGPWLAGNLIDFPDGRVGAVSAANAITGAACPAGMYCKRLRLYTPSGTGQNLTLQFSEDIILADTESGWPVDDHGIATDGTYLFQIRHVGGYKVWALRSGSPSYVVFNGDGSGACGANSGVSGTQCSITNGLINATYLTRNHVSKNYIVADYGAAAFYTTASYTPPAGPGTPNLPEAPTSVSATRGSSQATVSWTAPADPANGPVLSYTATASPGLATCTTSATSCVITGLTPGTTYSFSVIATNVTGDSPSSTSSDSITLEKTSQTISYTQPSAKTYGDSTFALVASSSSGLSVSFASNTSSICSVAGSVVTIITAGTCEVQASQSGNSTYLAATPAVISIAINKANQTLTFGNLSSKTFGDAGFTVSATADSSLSPTFSSTTPLICTATTAGEVRIVGAGTCTIRASQSGNNNFNAATAVSQSFTVAQASQSQLSITSASTMVYGDTLTLVATGGSGTGALTFSESSSTCQIANGNSLTATGTGSCVVSAVRSADTNYLASSATTLTITISASSQSINFLSSVPVSAVTGTTYTPRAISTSGLAVVFDVDSSNAGVCSIASGVVTFASSGSCVITARQSGNSNFLAAPSATQTIVAGKINQTILFPAISNKDFDSAAFLAGASVSSGRNVTYMSATPSVCEVNASTGTISVVTIGECSVTASSSGDSSYASASPVSRSFTIHPVTAGKPSITSVSFGDSSVTVAFVAPSFLGGDLIDGYQLVGTSISGTVIKPDCGVSSPCTITGLTNGTSYTFTVAAINAAGIGPASNASPAITPATIPDAVSALRTTPGNQQLVVEWDAFTLGQLGGATFTRYDISIRVRSNPWNPPVTVSNANLLDSRATNSFTFTGLTNGTAYDVKVVVVTSANGSELSSNTSTALGVPATTPSAPQELNVSLLSDSSALVAWSAPLDDGGASISSYDLSHSCVFIDSSQQSCVVSDLSPGTQQTFAVAAVNQVGRGQILSSSLSIPSLPEEQTSSGSNYSNGGTATSWNYSQWQSEEVLPESGIISPTSPQSEAKEDSSEANPKVTSVSDSKVWIWIFILVGMLLATSVAIYFAFKRRS